MAAVVMTTLIAHQRLLLIALGALHVVREQRKHALYRALRDWLASLMFRRPRRPRSYWAEQRRACLWHAMQLSWPGLPRHAEDQKYYSHFRVNKTGFKYVFSLVRDDLTPRHGPRAGIEAKRRFAMTMHWLAKAPMYDAVADLWGVGKSTVHKHLHATVRVLRRRLQHLLEFPSGNELHRIMNDFSFYTHGIPNVAGALDGCFIPMFKATGPFGFRYWC